MRKEKGRWKGEKDMRKDKEKGKDNPEFSTAASQEVKQWWWWALPRQSSSPAQLAIPPNIFHTVTI